MLSPFLQLRVRSGSNDICWRLLSSKLFKVAFTSFIIILLLTGLWQQTASDSGSVQPQTTPAEAADKSSDVAPVAHPDKGRLHMLIPATSSNADLCKLLLSAQILEYPTPQLINYGDTEDLEDPYKQHLAKVEGILKYLEHLDISSEYSTDLVLILDGYDIFLQLRPDVLVKRYYKSCQAADARTREQYGDKLFYDHDMRQTIVFGPDKLCWPVDASRPACWAVPEANLTDFAFGPATNNLHIEQFLPRWLNSGTIIGPVQDLRSMFNATLNAIHTNYTTDSDQFYFANIFGEQEYARLTHAPKRLKEVKRIRIGDEWNDTGSALVRHEPEIIPGRQTEYHIGIDTKSALFQTAAFYKQYITFTRPTDAWGPPSGQMSLGRSTRHRSAYGVKLPTDIRASAPPCHALDLHDEASANASSLWADVELLYNTVTGEIPVMMHFTGAYEKQLRTFWWQKLWFQRKARDLRAAAQSSPAGLVSDYPINGVMWYNAESADAEDIAFQGRGGAWSDGGWFSWKTLCKAHEAELYEPAVNGDQFWHAPPQKDDGTSIEAGGGVLSLKETLETWRSANARQ